MPKVQIKTEEEDVLNYLVREHSRNPNFPVFFDDAYAACLQAPRDILPEEARAWRLREHELSQMKKFVMGMQNQGDTEGELGEV